MPCSVVTSMSSSGHRGKSPTLVASGRRSGTTTGRTATSRTTSPAPGPGAGTPGAGTPGSRPDGELTAGTASSNSPEAPESRRPPLIRPARGRPGPARASRPAQGFPLPPLRMDDDPYGATTARRDSGRHVNIQEIRELIRVKRPELRATDRRLAHCHDIADLRRTARRLIPRPVFDYVDGGSDEELSLAGNVEAFRRWRFVPRALANVAKVDTAGQVLGHPVPLPLVLAPTGYTRIMHPGGEIASARAAARHGLPYTLSTMANTSIADLATAVHGDLWFQLYILTDDGLTRELVDRAAACGYRVLVVTVDTMVTGRRIRDVRNGLTLPAELTVRTVASIGSRPAYWMRMLRSPGANLANLPVRERVTIAGTGSFFYPGIDWDNIAALREQWRGKLVIKGPLGAADARRAVEAGVDGLQLSNHGGRQLDRAIAPIDLLPTVRDAVGPDLTVLVDSGVRHGTDIAIAIALGADAVAIGRASLYGLLTAGQPKVVLKVGTAGHLEDVVRHAQAGGLPVEVVSVAGRTQVTPGTLTC